jgi:hypothetical protein
MHITLLALAVCLLVLLPACDSAPSGVGNGKSGGAAPPSKATFTFEAGCPIASVWIPEGYEAKGGGPGACRAWLAPARAHDAGLVVDLAAMEHDGVREARDASSVFRDLRAGDSTWRVAIPDPYDERQSKDSFQAYLVTGDVAISVGGTGLGWSEEDVQRFLSRVRLASR